MRRKRVARSDAKIDPPIASLSISISDGDQRRHAITDFRKDERLADALARVYHDVFNGEQVKRHRKQRKKTLKGFNVLTYSYLQQIRRIKGLAQDEYPRCARCGKELKDGEQIKSRKGEQRRFYHRACWEGLLL